MARKKPAKRVEGVIRIAHDVRKLRTCVLCEGVGLEVDMAGTVTLAESGEITGLFHLSCYYEGAGEQKFLDLPRSDLRKTKISDVPARVMLKLLSGRA